jgi:hypothetical protein
MLSSNYSLVSPSLINHAGRVNPTAAPSACPAITMVSAVTLSCGANHVFANLAGELLRNGYPTAHTTYPAAHIQKLSLMRHLIAIPSVVEMVPINTASLQPCVSIINMLGKVKQIYTAWYTIESKFTIVLL